MTATPRDTRSPVSVVLPTASARTRLRPLSATDVTIGDGFWGERLRTNRDVTLRHGYEQLRAGGALHNLELAAGAGGSYRTFNDTFGFAFPFLDTDVYKWLEAVGWELGRRPDPDLLAMADAAIAIVAAAQRSDGYINSFVQVVGDDEPYRDLAWGHEMYCVGHLIQAGVAWQRALGDDRLLRIATAAADHLDRTLGPGGRDGIDGHPEIEMALVELSRVTGEGRYLDLAARFVALRGHGLLGTARFGPAYWQDHLPVREAPVVAGHAVRQLYLDAGAVDVAVELGDAGLLDAVIRRWDDMVATRSYLTGAVGSRHRDEAFGDPFELPPDEAYAETCAAIASVMLAWRLLLATGEPRFADLIERTIHNGVLSGLSRDGTHFFYVNPLQRRSRRTPSAADDDGARRPWYPCACCPPNLMRTLSSWEQYLATSDGAGVQLHQYTTSTIAAPIDAGRVGLSVATSYPWDGRVEIAIDETPDADWTLSLRVPAWCHGATLRGPDGASSDLDAGQGTVELHRRWHAGERVVIMFEMPARITLPDPRVEATRGCVAIERGPLVYAIESADLPVEIELEAVAVDPSGPLAEHGRTDVWPDAVGVIADGGPYDLRAIPYFAWANRELGAMRVWIPTLTSEEGPSTRER